MLRLSATLLALLGIYVIFSVPAQEPAIYFTPPTNPAFQFSAEERAKEALLANQGVPAWVVPATLPLSSEESAKLAWLARQNAPWGNLPQVSVYEITAEETAPADNSLLLACFAFAAAAGYGAQSMLAVGSEEITEKEATVGAAGLGGLLGVAIFGSLPAAVLLAGGFAYGTTKFKALKSAGGLTASAYEKAVELENRFEVLPKAKSAIDTVVTVADNLNNNYGLTDKIDEKLKLTERAESLTATLEEKKNEVVSKVDELKASATSVKPKTVLSDAEDI